MKKLNTVRIITIGAVIGMAMLVGMLATGCGGKKSPSSSSSSRTVTESPAPASSGTKASSSPNWKKALDDYEKFVDEYAAFMKKYNANPTDVTLLTQSLSMMEKAQKATDSIEKIENDIPDEDIPEFTARYSKLAQKMLDVASSIKL